MKLPEVHQGRLMGPSEHLGPNFSSATYWLCDFGWLPNLTSLSFSFLISKMGLVVVLIIPYTLKYAQE